MSQQIHLHNSSFYDCPGFSSTPEEEYGAFNLRRLNSFQCFSSQLQWKLHFSILSLHILSLWTGKHETVNLHQVSLKWKTSLMTVSVWRSRFITGWLHELYCLSLLFSSSVAALMSPQCSIWKSKQTESRSNKVNKVRPADRITSLSRVTFFQLQLDSYHSNN